MWGTRTWKSVFQRSIHTFQNQYLPILYAYINYYKFFHYWCFTLCQKSVIQVVFNLHTKVTSSWCIVSILSSHFPINLNIWKCVCNLTQVPYTMVAQTKTVVSMREGACVYIRIVGLERSVVLSIVERARGYRLRSTYLLIRNGCFNTTKYVVYRVSLRCKQLSRKGRWAVVAEFQGYSRCDALVGAMWLAEEIINRNGPNQACNKDVGPQQLF